MLDAAHTIDPVPDESTALSPLTGPTTLSSKAMIGASFDAVTPDSDSNGKVTFA
jgi:hypothetical protein